MRTAAIVILAAVLWVGCSCVIPKPQSTGALQDVAQTVLTASGRIGVPFDCNKDRVCRVRWCTGSVIPPRISRVRILTAAHCFGPNDRLALFWPHGQKRPIYFIAVKRDVRLDLVLLEGITAIRVPYLQLAQRSPLAGDRAVLVGYAGGDKSPVVVVGSVVTPQLEGDDAGAPEGTVRTLLTNRVVGGYSGGPVVDRSGALVGIVVRYRGFLNMGVAVGLPDIRLFLRE